MDAALGSPPASSSVENVDRWTENAPLGGETVQVTWTNAASAAGGATFCASRATFGVAGETFSVKSVTWGATDATFSVVNGAFEDVQATFSGTSVAFAATDAALASAKGAAGRTNEALAPEGGTLVSTKTRSRRMEATSRPLKPSDLPIFL
jgi:hypothetical protein